MIYMSEVKMILFNIKFNLHRVLISRLRNAIVSVSLQVLFVNWCYGAYIEVDLSSLSSTLDEAEVTTEGTVSVENLSTLDEAEVTTEGIVSVENLSTLDEAEIIIIFTGEISLSNEDSSHTSSLTLNEDSSHTSSLRRELERAAEARLQFQVIQQADQEGKRRQARQQVTQPVPNQPAALLAEIQAQPRQQQVAPAAQQAQGGLKESLLRRESGTVANPQNAANKVIIDQIAAPMMQSNSNIEQTITRLNNAGINFTEKEIATAFEDTIISFKLKAHQALLYAGSMAQLSQIERKTTTKQITQSTQSQNQVTKQIIAVLNGVIDSRLDEISLDNVIMSSGISAGDEFKPKLQGAWIRGTYGASKDNGTFSYIGNIAGATIGSDFELNEQTVVGAAYSNMSTAFKHKKNYAGDKTNSNSHILSLYGAYQLNDNISVKTMLSVGMTNIATKRSILNNIASGKIKNKNYNAKTSVSYNFKATKNIYLVPNLGLAYSHSSDDAYSEKGAGVHNISTKTKSNNNLTAIAGLNAIMPHKISNTLSIAPSIHASVESHLWNKKSKVKAKLAWMDDYFSNSLKANKTERFSYNIGGGITTQRDNIEIAMNYNCNIRQKYQNHQGSIKLKLAF